MERTSTKAEGWKGRPAQKTKKMLPGSEAEERRKKIKSGDDVSRNPVKPGQIRPNADSSITRFFWMPTNADKCRQQYYAISPGAVKTGQNRSAVLRNLSRSGQNRSKHVSSITGSPGARTKADNCGHRYYEVFPDTANVGDEEGDRRRVTSSHSNRQKPPRRSVG
jgi:hypothetical protein